MLNTIQVAVARLWLPCSVKKIVLAAAELANNVVTFRTRKTQNENIYKEMKARVHVRKSQGDDTTFLVTGGSGAIGRVLVKLLVSAGCTVYVCARTPAQFAAVRNTLLKDERERAKYIELVLDDPASLQNFLEKTLPAIKIDYLVNNAGVCKRGESVRGIDANLYINFLVPLRMSIAAATHGVKRIVNVGSCMAFSSECPKDLLAYNKMLTTRNSLRNMLEWLTSRTTSYSVSKIYLGTIRYLLSGEAEVVTVHPGIVNSDILTRSPAVRWLLNTVESLFPAILYSRHDGAVNIIYALLCADAQFVTAYRTGYYHPAITSALSSKICRQASEMS